MKNRILGVVLFFLIGCGFERASALTFAEATNLIKQNLDNSEIASMKHYCVKGTMTCRTMYTLRDKITKLPADMFYDTFYSADRQVGSTCYFVPNNSGVGNTFYQLSDTVFDGQLAINLNGTDSAKISGDENARTFSDLNFKRLGTSRYILGSMLQKEDRLTIIGTEFDSADANYGVSVSIEYLRIYP